MALLDLLEPLLVHWQTILIASAIFLVYFYWIVPYRAARAIYPKGPIPLPFIGHLWDTVKHKGLVHLQMDEYCKKYGQVYSMLTFGSKPCIIISDPEMLRDIFVKEFGSFADRPVFFKLPEPLNSMLTIATKDKWKRIRNTLSPAFSALKMKQIVPLMNICCDNLIKKLGEFADKEESVDIKKLHQCLTMDAIVSAAFGFQVNSQNNPDDPVLKAAKKAMNQSTSQKILLTFLSTMPFGAKIMEKIPSLWMSNNIPLLNITEEIVHTKRESGGSSSTRKDMLDLMLAASDDPSVPETKKLSDMEVIAQSLVFLAAGYETTSTTLSFVSHHLAINPEIQDKLQQEIDSVWPDENQMLSYETVHEMPYLDMVLAESLRMYPPGFVIVRVCTKACVLKGVKIPEGLIVVIPVYSIQRDPSIYPDPDEFDPERFSPAAKQSINPYSYMPFGHGPHNCIGMRFAQMEMKMVLARMLKKYRLEVAADTKIPPDVFVASTLSCSGVNVRITSRK
nr:cytochrome P450 3A30-like [Pocillopora verrucosa]